MLRQLPWMKDLLVFPLIFAWCSTFVSLNIQLEMMPTQFDNVDEALLLGLRLLFGFRILSWNLISWICLDNLATGYYEPFHSELMDKMALMVDCRCWNHKDFSKSADIFSKVNWRISHKNAEHCLSSRWIISITAIFIPIFIIMNYCVRDNAFNRMD